MSVGGASALDAPRALANPDLSHYYSYAPSSPSQSSLFDDILPVADSFALDLAHLDPSQAHHHSSLGNLANNSNNLNNGNADMFPDFHLDDFLVAHHDAFDNSPSFFPEECAPATTAGLQPPFGASTDGCDDGRNAVTV